MPESLSELEREMPESSMKPHVHPMVHYPKCVQTLGPLTLCWILGDERRNKVIKNMSKHRGRCEASIARVYSEYVAGRDRIVCPDPVALDTACTGKYKPYVSHVHMYSYTRAHITHVRKRTLTSPPHTPTIQSSRSSR